MRETKPNAIYTINLSDTKIVFFLCFCVTQLSFNSSAERLISFCQSRLCRKSRRGSIWTTQALIR